MAIRKEFSFVLPNKPGTLAEVAAALAHAKVNLLAVDASGGFEYNIVRIVPDNPAKAKRVLARQGLDVSITQILCVPMKDAPGSLAKVCHTLARAKINIDYLYASGGQGGGSALIIAHVTDLKKAARLLAD